MALLASMKSTNSEQTLQAVLLLNATRLAQIFREWVRRFTCSNLPKTFSQEDAHPVKNMCVRVAAPRRSGQPLP